MIATTKFFSIQGIVCHEPLWFDGGFFLTCAGLKALRSTAKIFTVKPRLTATSVIRSPGYYDHFFFCRLTKTALQFLVKNLSLIRPIFLAF